MVQSRKSLPDCFVFSDAGDVQRHIACGAAVAEPKTAVLILTQAAFSDTPPVVQSPGGPASLVAMPASPPALPLAAAPDEHAAAKPEPAAVEPEPAPTALVPPAEPPAQVREPSINRHLLATQPAGSWPSASTYACQDISLQVYSKLCIVANPGSGCNSRAWSHLGHGSCWTTSGLSDACAVRSVTAGALADTSSHSAGGAGGSALRDCAACRGGAAGNPTTRRNAAG